MEWIKCSDRLPDRSSRSILIYGSAKCGNCDSAPCVREGRYNSHYSDDSDLAFEFGEYDCSVDVTHWMPLPDAPEE